MTSKLCITLTVGATVFLAGFVLPLDVHVGAAEFQLETSDGSVITGTWAGASESGIRLDDGSGARDYPVDTLVALRPAEAVNSASSPPIGVTLVDGTSIFAQEIGMDDSTIKVEPRRQPAIELPIKQVQSIRFRLGAAATDPQWFGLIEKETRSDMMVIRRGNDQLDPIEGIVVGLTAENLLFDLDGDTIEAPRDRLEGVVFRTSEQAARKTSVKLVDRYGSTYLAARLEPSDSGDAVDVILSGGIKHSLPIDQVKSINWSSGRILLANETPASSDFTAYLKTSVPRELTNAWFAPKAKDDDIVAAAGGSAEYRIADGFQTLAGSVGRDESVNSGSEITIRVLVDGEVSWEQSLVDRSPKGFRIPIAGARRVRLEVLAGRDGDVGDQVRFLKPRLIK